MELEEKNCCPKQKSVQNRGILSGILYGLIPHSFCIAFIIFSIIGATTATAFLKNFLVIPNLFIFLVLISLLLATVSSIIYLKKTNCFCISRIKNKWRYISVMYSTTILVNLLMFFVIIPSLVNANLNAATPNKETNLSELSIKVQLPCSGHASLIMDEIKKNYTVSSIKFELPDTFKIEYDPRDVSPEKIASLEIFKTYPVTIN